jgi:HEAT repeat protein
MLAAALSALGDLGETEARAAIEPHVRDADPTVADAAQAALQALERGRAGRRCGEQR